MKIEIPVLESENTLFQDSRYLLFRRMKPPVSIPAEFDAQKIAVSVVDAGRELRVQPFRIEGKKIVCYDKKRESSQWYCKILFKP